MPRSHLAKTLQSAKRQPDGKSATVPGTGFPGHKTFKLELVCNSGHVAARDHHAPGKLVHAQPIVAALQLRHEVKARQRGIKFAPEAEPDLVLNAHRA